MILYFRGWILVTIVASLCCAAEAQSRRGGTTSDHWVATWATAQQLMPGGFGGRGGSRGGAVAGRGPAQSTTSSSTTSATATPPTRPQSGPNASNLPSSFADETVRMVVRTSIGGARVRLRLSNMMSAQPLVIGAAHVAVHKGAGAIDPATDHSVTFGGAETVTVQPGVLVLSDPVDLAVGPLSDLAISLYFPEDTGAPTNHNIGLHSAYITKGNKTASPTSADATVMFAYVWLAGVEVAAPADSRAVVAFGDSITDGYATTRDANHAWPTLLAQRLNANSSTRGVAVVNEGISGNQVLRDGAGLSALNRLDRDVLSLPGVKWVILLEGINDINIRGRSDGPNALTDAELIWGYRQFIDRCHEHGIKVMGATIMPEEGVPTASERGEAIRQSVNKWIRTKGNFDAVIDFDAVVRDPERPKHIKAGFDPGDHIHPNDAGNEAMANAFDSKGFRD